ncbi:MAG: hypothetical protein AB7F31_02250 [Parachlamydiales bacterium]
MERVVALVREGALGVFEGVKATPLSTAWVLYCLNRIVPQAIKGGNREDHIADKVPKTKFKYRLARYALIWLVLREAEPILLARPVSSGLLAYELYRVGRNASPWEPEEGDKWNHLGSPDIALLAAAVMVRLTGPALFTHRYLAWVR